MAVPPEVVALIERFERNLEAYRSGHYNETQVRREFIDPFFKALGWDVDNTQGYAEPYKDVIHEDAIKIAGASKAPDYSFRIGGVRKFFLEAKKPSVNIKDDVSPAYQLRRYAWSAKLPLSILTDFEEFAVYDCRIRPDVSDKASTARIQYFTFREYTEKWDDIASIFSRDAILKGAFDKFAESAKTKRGTAEVDESFLQEIESWRASLARSLALRNSHLSQREVNFAVQRTIDRIIFLRMCEDRGIEPYQQLSEHCSDAGIYKHLLTLYRKADERYNSGLFHFQKERDRSEAPDLLTPTLTIDDKCLKDIIDALYYPESPFEFSVISADILGQVYEQFLGKVIRLTQSHHAVVEDKPEVKKSGGVYYTPTYIVENIVSGTLGKLLEGRTVRQARKLRIVDPACGSGSFLLGAYQLLLDWYRDQYVKDGPRKHTKELYEVGKSVWRLTTAERKRILLDHIFGVDIDTQAVEVTKLSLLLKVLEGESEQTLSSQLRLFHERALPDLGKNIKCGNSLIGEDFWSSPESQAITEDERLRVNPFDWNSAFPEVFSQGGFDAVIGNPPYVRIQTLSEWAPIEAAYYKTAYASAGEGNFDIYVAFIEKGLRLLNQKGRLGYIVSSKFLNAKYGQPLRALLAAGQHLHGLVHFGAHQVFEGPTTYTCLLFLATAPSSRFAFSPVDDLLAWRTTGRASTATLPASRVTGAEWTFQGGKLIERLTKMKVKLKDVSCRIFQGLVTGADPVFVLETRGRNVYFSDATEEEHELESDLLHPLCKGSVDIRRYCVGDLSKVIIFPYALEKGRARLLSAAELDKSYPQTWKYLKKNRERLEGRERGKWKHDRWYAFGRSQNLSEMEQKKILTPSIARQAAFTLDARDYYYFLGSGGGGGGGYGITLRDTEQMAYEYVLGILNSTLADRFVKSGSSPFRGGYYAFNRQYIEAVPIRPIDFSKPDEVKLHDEVVTAVKDLLALNKRLLGARTDHEREAIQRQVGALEKAVDQLVYRLYDVSEQEQAELAPAP